MILAILQARMSSSRLPGKVARPMYEGRPMMALQIERLRRSRAIDRLMVATSTNPEDAEIATICESLDIPCFRGPLDDVLERYYLAAAPMAPEHVVRLTADCPLADWTVADAVIGRHLETGADYTSNTIPPTFPDGLDVEVTTFAALTEARSKATSAFDHEHVTPYIKTTDGFSRTCVRHDPDLGTLRWTVDTPDDFAMVQAVYEAVYPADPEFDFPAVLAFLQSHPEIAALNHDAEGVALTCRATTGPGAIG